MRKTLGTLAAVAMLAGATNVWAVEDPNSPTQLLAPVLSGGGGPEVNANTDFEPPLFAAGAGAQNGWTLSPANTTWTISNVTPMVGTQDATLAPLANLNQRYISPTDPLNLLGTQSALVRIDTAAASFSFGLEILGTGPNINARVLLQPTLNIEVLQAVGGVGVFTDIGDYVVGQTVKIGIETLADTSQRIYINDVLAFTGTDINFAVTGVFSPPNRAVGQGFTATAITGRGSVDNFSFVAIPEPTSLGLAAIAATGLIRRRRA